MSDLPDLGHFSISLAVKDISASRAFYSTLGFESFDGDAEQGWLMLRRGEIRIGLFQGMFEENLMTFNPPDVRAIQARLKESGVALEKEADDGEGPAHIVVKDPDGNVLLMDQF